MFEVVGCSNPVWYFAYAGLYIEVLGVPTLVTSVPGGYTGNAWHEWLWEDGDCLDTESLCSGEYPLANHVPQTFRCNVIYSAGLVIFTSWSGVSSGIISCDSTTDGTLSFEQCDPFLQVWDYGSAFSCACLAFPGITVVVTEA